MKTKFQDNPQMLILQCFFNSQVSKEEGGYLRPPPPTLEVFSWALLPSCKIF